MFAKGKLLALALVVGAAGYGWGHSGRAAEARPVAVARYTVRPGDTLWAIAGRVAPREDPRAVVDRILRRNGLVSPLVRPGETIVIPAR